MYRTGTAITDYIGMLLLKFEQNRLWCFRTQSEHLKMLTARWTDRIVDNIWTNRQMNNR